MKRLNWLLALLFIASSLAPEAAALGYWIHEASHEHHRHVDACDSLNFHDHHSHAHDVPALEDDQLAPPVRPGTKQALDAVLALGPTLPLLQDAQNHPVETAAVFRPGLKLPLLLCTFLI